MKARQKRFVFILVALAAVTVASALVVKAMRSNITYFYSPSQVVAGEAPEDQQFRIGGMVVRDSLKRDPESIRVRFLVTDNAEEFEVVYDGILPDLFSEGQGAVARGRLENGVFVAEEVLAKHDESYMPPEVADSMQPGEYQAP
ncbi:MAG: cytochrome c maturation protein CcmE [Gammaproteobacteria bacterium]